MLHFLTFYYDATIRHLLLPPPRPRAAAAGGAERSSSTTTTNWRRSVFLPLPTTAAAANDRRARATTTNTIINHRYHYHRYYELVPVSAASFHYVAGPTATPPSSRNLLSEAPLPCGGCAAQQEDFSHAQRRLRGGGYSTALSLRAQQTAALWCPLYTRIASPLEQSHSRAVVSLDAVTCGGGTRSPHARRTALASHRVSRDGFQRAK